MTHSASSTAVDEVMQIGGWKTRAIGGNAIGPTTSAPLWQGPNGRRVARTFPPTQTSCRCRQHLHMISLHARRNILWCDQGSLSETILHKNKSGLNKSQRHPLPPGQESAGRTTGRRRRKHHSKSTTVLTLTPMSVQEQYNNSNVGPINTGSFRDESRLEAFVMNTCLI